MVRAARPAGGHYGPAPSIGDLTASVPGDYVQLRRLDGSVVSGKSGFVPQFEGGASGPKPKLPKTIKLPAGSAGRDRVVFFTVPAVSGGGHYRVRASIEAYEPNNILVIAAPLTGVESTLHRLLLIELLVTALVLAAIVALGLWVVRLGLKPLVAIGGTAAAIASGDLSQRVERAEPNTEVGRLGIALNAMLAQIESSLRALEASERKLRRFVADASHELRTPLAAVRAYAELFERGAGTRPDDLARSMRGIERESERMSVLVDDLLLLARLDEGRPLERARVDLGTLVAEAVETAHAVEPDRPIEISTVPLVVLGDRVRLRQAIDNLLANVRAHTPAGTPGARDALSAGRARRASRSRTPARGSKRPRWLRSSSASTAPTPRAPARAAEPASGCRSSRRSRSRTADRRGRNPSQAKARRSSSSSRWPISRRTRSGFSAGSQAPPAG